MKDGYDIEEKEKLKNDVLAWAVTCRNLEREKKDLRLQSDTYFNEWQGAKNEIVELKEQLMIVKNDNALLKSILND